MPAFEAQPGMPYWLDLLTSEARKSAYFYSRILGWDVSAGGADESSDESYRIARVQGLPVAGMVQQVRTDTAGTADAGGDGVSDGDGISGAPMPDTWVASFLSTDIAADTQRVAELGGRVLAEPAQVSLGTMALCADAAGAWFGLFQPQGEDAFVAAGEPGTPVWYEYASTSNVRGVLDFYGELFGWDIVENDGYYLVMRDGAAFAGIWDASPQIPADVPSFWRAFLGVANVAETRSRIEEFGGEVLRGPENSPFGLLLTAADSTGAVVTLCEVDEPVDEDALDEGDSILHL